MMTQCSQRGSEIHSIQCSTCIREPPTQASTPPLEEGVNRGSDEWGNTMGKKQHMMVQVLFQNVGSFSSEEDMEVKWKN